MFHHLANLPTDHSSIAKSLANRKGKPGRGGSAIPQIQSEPGEVQDNKDTPAVAGKCVFGIQLVFCVDKIFSQSFKIEIYC